ncbi:MAG: potassium transporter [Marinomonas sp.]|jgi:trk system potassium uptake protein TrkH|uniref:Trk system potassium uptake protein n=1 Tax=Marinomonas communis TaxID=28254 RepID=A0A4R6X589_9GAMM|nr:TrkH family potassium uptake protein [Marinomonas communis]MAF15770.1 potassium transporter [Marinomonas sp.]MCC4274263.1 TrkH family potassium uptake protein [Marinomonas communis]RUM48934.1 MAG: potassium transporter [Marinomonas sp.]TDR14132.1 trk system potassium uptake protein TrkH [Marinomonas communis]
MHIQVILRVIGLLIMIFSLTLLPPIIVSLIYQDGALQAFLYALLINLASGLVIWFPFRNHRGDLKIRDGFLVTVLFWTTLGLFGSVPFFLATDPHLSFTDSLFESLSGLTTTGATILTAIDDLPQSILFYRQWLQWLGGMGIIVLAVAIMPMLGVGGMQLYRAETPGPVKDSKLTPRIAETAKALWYIYASLTIVCTLSYWAAGMSFFDALCHSFSTVAIGGFSTHDASIGYFNSVTIEIICTVFMVIAALNFGLHFYAWRMRSVWHYFKDPEARFFFFLLGSAISLATLVLILTETFDWQTSLRYAIFESVSIATTAGFSTSDFSVWPHFLPFLLIVTSFAGGCASSTGGGMKVIRILLILKQGFREIQRLVHPNAVIPVKVGGKAIQERVVSAVWGFFSAYLLVYVILMIGLMATGIDQVTAWSAVAATLNNLGPGLGEVAANFASINDPSKWMLCFAMLLGRLEVFTLLVLFTPMFWQK